MIVQIDHFRSFRFIEGSGAETEGVQAETEGAPTEGTWLQGLHICLGKGGMGLGPQHWPVN